MSPTGVVTRDHALAPSRATPLPEAIARRSRWAFGVLLALAALAPFELQTPWLAWPGQRFTNVEVVALAAVAAALVMSLPTHASTPQPCRMRLPSGLGLAWLWLCAALALSSLLAPVNVVPALKITARLVAAGAVAWATTVVLTSQARRTWLVSTMLGSGVVVALGAMVESAEVPWALHALEWFRPGPHVVGGQIRAASSLQYPTIASMHLEMVFAAGLGLLLSALDKGRAYRWIPLALAVALALVAEGVVLTFTRAGVAALLATLLIVAVRRWSLRGADRGVAVLAVLGVGVVAALGLSYSTENLWLRLTTESQAEWYRAEYRVPPRLRMAPRAIVEVPLEVANTGRVTWRPTANPPFLLSYHWLEADADRVVSYDGLRTAFPAPVAPSTTVGLVANVEAPAQPGRYRLAWDVVLEQRLWFSTEASESAMTEVVVEGPPAPPPVAPRRGVPSSPSRPGRLVLWHTAAAMLRDHPLWGVGPDNFRWLYPSYTDAPNADTRVHTNNMFVEVLVSGGLIGGVAFAWCLWHAARLVRGGLTTSGEERWLAAGAASGLLAMLLHGSVDSFLTFTPSYVMAAMTAGLLTSLLTTGAAHHANRL